MKNKLVLKRHKIITSFLGPVINSTFIGRYGAKVIHFDNPEHRQYLIMMNHQTGADQFFVSAAFDDPVYFIATEDLFSNGLSSSIIKFLVGPIPIKKNATDMRAVKNAIRVVKEGGSICLAPEGNRTFSGSTAFIKPSIAKFAKTLRIPIAFFIFDGGYGVQPRWSDCIRSGGMTCKVTKVIEPEVFMEMTDDELYDTIVENLSQDESNDKREYFSKHNAEYAERFLYICPDCGFSEFESNGDLIKCKKCGKEVRYLPNKTLEPLSGTFKFNNLKEWHDYQEDFINNLKLSKISSDKLFYQDTVSFFDVALYKKKTLLDKNALIKLYIDRIEVELKGDLIIIDFDNVEVMSVLGKNKLNIYHKDKIYQIKGDKRFNPVKYMHLYFKYSKFIKGEEDDKFLGL